MVYIGCLTLVMWPMHLQDDGVLLSPSTGDGFEPWNPSIKLWKKSLNMEQMSGMTAGQQYRS